MVEIRRNYIGQVALKLGSEGRKPIETENGLVIVTGWEKEQLVVDWYGFSL